MKIKDIVEIVDGEFVSGEEFGETEVLTACASDMMSDVLAFVKEQAVLITGLCNPQVIRTAEMMEMCCIVFVRGKRPDQMMIDAAKAKGIALICSPLRMFLNCGLLFAKGLKAEF